MSGEQFPHSKVAQRRAPRRPGLWAVAAVLIALAGCGISVDAPQCNFFSNVCNPRLNQPIAWPSASVWPQRQSAQVGSAVVLTVRWSNLDQPSFQLRRSADDGRPWVDIAGATGAVFTPAAAWAHTVAQPAQARAASACANNNAWQASAPQPSLRAADFQQVSSPACGASESCPDSSAQATPLCLGFVRQAQQNAGSEARTMVHGIDNWKATVWRR